MMALAEKTGRRPSLAERTADHAMDAAESELTFGKPAFQIALMAALFVERNRFDEAEAARQSHRIQSESAWPYRPAAFLHCRAGTASFSTRRKIIPWPG